MGRAAPCFYLGIDRACHLITRKEFRRASVVVGVGVPAVGFLLRRGVLLLEDIRDVVEHEPTPVGVGEDTAVTADGLGHQEPAHTGRPHHARGMELHEFHVDEIAPALQCQSVAVAGVLPGVARDLEGLADPAGGDDDGRRVNKNELTAGTPVGEHAAHAPIITLARHEDLGDRALGEDANAGLVVTGALLVCLLQRDDLLLESTDHLEAGAIAHVRQPRIFVPPEIPLTDAAILRAIEQCTPGLEFPHALRSLLGMQLRHAVVVEELAAAHRVAEVHVPVVIGVDVRHRSGDAALGHHRVRLAEERLAHDSNRLAHLPGLDGRAQAGATGTDNDDVERVALHVSHDVSSSTSEQIPIGNDTGRYFAHIQVGQRDHDERNPREAHVVHIQAGHESPRLVPDRMLRKVLQAPSHRMATRVAGQRIQPQAGGVQRQDQGADAHMPPSAVGVTEGDDGVPGQDHVEDQAEVEEVAVRVLQDKRKARLTRVVAMGFGNRTSGR